MLDIGRELFAFTLPFTFTLTFALTHLIAALLLALAFPLAFAFVLISHGLLFGCIPIEWVQY